ncbi:hypothetical protein C7A11_31080 [Pseudomonas simiae]|nr:hypothetical protein C7A11_31080 [Pseudomonas simiae]
MQCLLLLRVLAFMMVIILGTPYISSSPNHLWTASFLTLCLTIRFLTLPDKRYSFFSPLHSSSSMTQFNSKMAAMSLDRKLAPPDTSSIIFLYI